MKKNILTIGLAGVLGTFIALSSCGPDYETEFNVLTLTVPSESQAAVVFPLAGGEHEIEVETNVALDNWTASSNAGWCKLQKQEGKVTVSAGENEDYKQRIAEITIAYGHQSYSINVKQFGLEPVIEVEGLTADGMKVVDSKVTSLTIPVSTNLNLDVITVPDTCDWVRFNEPEQPKAKKSQQAERAENTVKKNLTFTLNQNTDTIVRYCTVTLQSSQNYNCVGTLIIKQQPRGYIVDIDESKKEYQVKATGETITIPFKVNGPADAYTYEVEASAREWITPLPATRGMRDASESFIIQPNTIEEERVGHITFRSTDPIEPNEFTVTVTQEKFVPVPPEGVKNPTATPGAGFIKLKWEMPVNVNFTKMKVIYHDPVTKEDKELEIADNTTTLFIVENTFKCGGEYEFTIKTYGPTGMETEQPATVRGTSEESVIKARIALTVDMFSANATEPSEGSLAALVDDNINTYYHTIWSGTSPNKQPHYLQINMSELPLQSLRFEYDGRNNGNGAGDVKRVGIWGSDNGNTWIDHGSAEKLLCGGADILKELGQTFTYDGTTVTSKNDGADQENSGTIITNELLGAGQYAAWAFKVNYAGELSGTYQVLETIPDGMELAYIRIKWVGGQNFDTINSKEDSDLETSGWTKKTISAATDNGGQSKTTTYYVKGNQALIKLGDFTAGKKRDDYSVDVQVVCRVTDPDVLLGGKEKRFTNQVTLQTEGGQDISTATSPATITPKKLEKTYTPTSPKSEKINFTIEANQFGEALSTKDGTTLTLIDKLSSTLILDTETIKVINSKTGALVTDYTASLDADNTLKIVIPRNVPVTITYTAVVNAPPGQKVSFSNEAYWENYSSAGGDSVEENNYSYAAGGTVTAGKNIKLKIIKKDQNNLSAKLQGAVFKVVPCIVENGQIKDNTDKMWTGTTNDKGELLFGEGSDQNHVMDYNTIYKVTEETAPSGYVADSKPIYIMVPRKEENATDYSDYVNNCIKDSRIHIQYQSIYELTVLNHKGEITVEKKFKNAGGHDSNPVSGTYTFGLYENADGTNTTNSTNQDGTTSTTTPLQTITITYNAAETGSKTAKFTNLDLTDNQNQTKTYYVFELDDNGNPIKDSTTAATVNKMEYFTSYAKTTTDGTTTGVNSAVSGDTVTVTNQIRVKELPSTGSYGPLIFRLAGAVLIFFAGLQMLINIKKRACNNR